MNNTPPGALPLPNVPGLEDLEFFARGGYATVYRAIQRSVGREVAVKVENRSLNNERDQRRFMREARAAGRMSSHPHVVDLFDVGVTADQHPYLIMEMCDGSYADRMRDSPLGAAEARDVGVKIADALADAHQLGVLHRDVKPANILYSRFSEPALADFGLAIIAETRDSTVTLEVLTPAYAPPEMFSHHPPAPAVDVYALCATLYAVMHGRPPRWQDDRNPSLITVMEMFTRPIPELPGIPTALIDILRFGMATDPADRPSAEQLRDMLAAVPLGPYLPGPISPVAGSPIPGAQVSGQPFSGRPVSGAPLAGGAVSGAAASGSPYPVSVPPSSYSTPPGSYSTPPGSYSTSPGSYSTPPGGYPADGHLSQGTAGFSGGHHPTVPTRPERRRLRWVLGGLGAIALLVAVASGSWYAASRNLPDSLPTGGPYPPVTSSPTLSVPAGGALRGCLAPLPGGGQCPGELECFAAVRVTRTAAKAQRVPCTGRHTWETYATGDLPAEVDITDHEAVKADPVVRQICNQVTFHSTTLLMDTTGWQFEVLPPTGDAAAVGDRAFRCLAGKGANQLIGPALGD